MNKSINILTCFCIILLFSLFYSCQKSIGTMSGEKNPAQHDLQGQPAEKISNEFVPFDTPPQPVKGYAELKRIVGYPETARKAGIEGKVLVQAYIDAHGDVTETKVIESLGNNGCDESAVKAITTVKWIPAQLDDEPVAVWITIPIAFKLN